MAGDLIRYITWQITIWVFAFSYWVTSIEMPRAITKQRSLSHMNVSIVDESNSELKYKVGLWLGIILNFLVVLIYIVVYGKECM